MAILRALVATSALLTLSALLGGCDTFPSQFTCTSDTQCALGGRSGECRFGGCAFTDDSCASGLRFHESATGAGMCVGTTPPPVDGGRRDSGGTNACGGPAPLDNEPGEPCGRCLMGAYVCDGSDAVRCAGQPTNEVDVTGTGLVTASTTLSGAFEARLAVDGDVQTGWLSAGPSAETTGNSVFEWTVSEALCISQVTIIGNGSLLDPTYRRDHGFDAVTIDVVDQFGTTQSSTPLELAGTPDPTVMANPNAAGRKVRLVFSGHESSEGGGFAELTVTGAFVP